MKPRELKSLDDWCFHQCVILGDRIDGIKKDGVNIGFINTRTGEKCMFSEKEQNQ